jgi:predicted PurR-regulated permease PerM
VSIVYSAWGPFPESSTMPPTTPAAHRDVPRITLTVLGVGVLVAGSLWVLRPFLLSLLWAAIIVVSTWPAMLRLQAWLGGRRGAAVAIMTVALLLVLFAPLYLAVATVVEQSGRIGELVHTLTTRKIPPPPPSLDAWPLVGHEAAGRWRELASLEPDQLAERVTPHVRTAVRWFVAQAGSFGSTLLNFLITVVISAILYGRGERAAGQVLRFFRRLSGERGDVIVTLSGKAIRAVALGIVVTALAQTALAGIGLALVRVPFAGLICAVAFILCIAQLGPLLAMLPWVIWLYATGSPGRGTVLLIFMVVAQTIDQVLRPVLIKRTANLSLLLILPGVIGGLLWLGIIGLFVGPVILAVGSTLLDGWIASGLGETAPRGAKGIAPGAIESERGTSPSVPPH